MAIMALQAGKPVYVEKPCSQQSHHEMSFWLPAQKKIWQKKSKG